MPEEEKHGTDARLDDLYSKDSLRLSVDSSDPDAGSKRATFVAPSQIAHSQAEMVGAVILSCGAVAALFHFINLCFAHPDLTNGILTLMFTVLIPELVKLWQKRKEKKADE